MEVCPTLVVCSMNICWRICETCEDVVEVALLSPGCFFHISVLLYEVIISSIVFPHKHFLFFPLCSRRDVLSGVTLSWGFSCASVMKKTFTSSGWGACISCTHFLFASARGGSHLYRFGGERSDWRSAALTGCHGGRRNVGHDVRAAASLRFCRAPLLSCHLSSRGAQVRSVCDTNKLKLNVMSHRVNRLHLGRLMKWITSREFRISRRRREGTQRRQIGSETKCGVLRSADRSCWWLHSLT